jgi:hypothetical protein
VLCGSISFSYFFSLILCSSYAISSFGAGYFRRFHGALGLDPRRRRLRLGPGCEFHEVGAIGWSLECFDLASRYPS